MGDHAPNLYRTPLSRARGFGAAKTGVNRFIAERATGIALVPLSLWAVYAGLRIAQGGYDGAVALLHSPVNAALAALLVGFSCAHMNMGMAVIVEDYIHKPATKVGLLLLSAGVCWLAGAIGVLSILKVAFSGVGAY